MIPDNNAWVEIVIVAVTVVGAGCGALVGFIVVYLGLAKSEAQS
jgi:ribose/xylose/arabinose/galactoside ABC-type transport system permease subunit